MKELAIAVFKILFFGSLLSAAVGSAIAYFSKVTFLAAMFFTWGAVWLNSSLLSYEDAMPGGFDNLDGKVPSEFQGLGKLKFWLLTLAGAAVLFGQGGYFYVNEM
jgi:hypothetical protein